MKIVLFASLPEDINSIKGGVESATLNLIDGLSEINPDSKITILVYNSLLNKTIDYKSNVVIEYVKFKFKIVLFDYFLTLKTLKKKLKQLSPDIIHIQGAAPFLLRFLFLKKNNIVVTQHGIMTEEYKYQIGVVKKGTFLFKIFVEKYIFPLFENFIFITEFNYKLFPNKISNDSFAIIPNSLSPYYSNINSTLCLNNNLVFVGAINERKNLLLLLESLDHLYKQGVYAKLTVVGGFNEPAYEEVIKSFLAKSPINENIVFTGWKDRNGVVELLEQNTVFVLPSNQETLPLSIAEAMSLGKIVVASDVGGVNEMIEHGETGFLFNRGDRDQLSDIIFKIVKGQEKLEEISSNAKKYSDENYSHINVANKTLEFYRTVLNRNKKQK